jgi:hypothetical protein
MAWCHRVLLRLAARAGLFSAPAELSLEQLQEVGFSPAAPEEQADSLQEGNDPGARLRVLQPRLFARLSPRQIEVYNAIKREPSIKMASRRLGMSPHDVRRSRDAIVREAQLLVIGELEAK